MVLVLIFFFFLQDLSCRRPDDEQDEGDEEVLWERGRDASAAHDLIGEGGGDFVIAGEERVLHRKRELKTRFETYI